MTDRLITEELASVDPQVAEAIRDEERRQEDTLGMIASENFAPLAVMQAQGSVLTNKYAEGYPGRRYYGGCEHFDVIEDLAIQRAKDLFGAEAANVQPHSGAQANAAAMFALLQPGDTIMGLDLAHGGHLTHGMKINYSGRLYEVVPYHVGEDDHLVDMAEVEALAREHRPRLIIAGWSAYPRQLDFPAFRRIADEVGAYLMVDMAHFAGLVATGLHPNPVPIADVITTTTHKTLGGPRGGIIFSRADLAKKINSAVFPGQQGGPLEHVIAAKAVAMKIAAGEAFRERQERTLAGARILADRLSQPDLQEAGVSLVSGGTDVHLVLVDLRDSELDGQQAEDRLHSIGIGEPQRGAVRSPPAHGLVRVADRDAGAGDPRLRRRRVRRGGRAHRGCLAARIRGRAARHAQGPRHGARAPPASVQRGTRQVLAAYDTGGCDVELSELDVSLLRLLAQGRTVKSVRRQLDLSERTVRRHLILMAENLDAGRSTIEVVIAAVRTGLV